MEKADFLVLGSGIGGLSFAIHAAMLCPDRSVVIVTKSAPGDSATSKAQGGIAGVLSGNESAVARHIEDTMRAGGGLPDRAVVDFVVREAGDCIREIMEWGVAFDRDGEGNLDLALEGGHSEHRILHKGDQSGLEISTALVRKARSLPNILILENLFATRLITDANGECRGAWVLDAATGSHAPLLSASTMIAAGGIGQLFPHTTNPGLATGDGIAMAIAAGAEVRDMEFIQFHPTALYHPGERPAFLVSEAVRGAGAVLRAVNGRRIMRGRDPREDLAPRDIVSRAIHSEMRRSGQPCVYLDCTGISGERFRRHFPAIHARCAALGIDPASDPVPVAPAMHYLCGGVVCNALGETTVPGLYVCGESARTGLHGANRLASNSLLEALVFAKRAAKHAARRRLPTGTWAGSEPVCGWAGKTDEAANKLRGIMSGMGIAVSTAQLHKMHSELMALRLRMSAGPEDGRAGRENWEFVNMSIVAATIVRQALVRSENRGAFYNTDLIEDKNVRYC